MKDKRSINFEPLRSKVTSAELYTKSKQTSQKRFVVTRLVCLAVFLVVAAYATYALTYGKQPEGPTAIFDFWVWMTTALVWGGVICAWSLMGYKTYRKKVYDEIRFSRFLKQNPEIDRFSYSSKVEDRGALVDATDGGDARIKEGILIRREGQPWVRELQVFNLDGGQSAKIGLSSDKNTKFGVARALLGSDDLPQVYMRALSGKTAKGDTKQFLRYKKSQLLKVTSAFDAFFEVYVPEGLERDALYFLTPELLEEILDYAKEFDIEVRENALYLYLPGGIVFSSYDELSRVVYVAELLSMEFTDNTQLYQRGKDGFDRRLKTDLLTQLAQANKKLSNNEISTVRLI